MKRWLSVVSLAFALPVHSAAPDPQKDAAYLNFLQDLVAATASDSLVSRAGRLHRSSVPEGSGDEAFQSLLARHWQWQMETDPEWATFVGFPGQDQRWTPRSLEAEDARRAMQRETLAAVRTIQRESLSPDNRLNLDLFLYELQTEVDGYAFPEQLILVTPMYGVHTSLASVLGGMPLFTTEQVENYLARLGNVDQVLTEATATLRAGLKAGVTPPRVSLQSVPGQALGLVPDNADDSPLLQPLAEMSADVADPEALRTRAREIYASRVKPAVQEFAAFLNEEYVPGAVEATGLANLPDGEAWYAWRARSMTTTSLSPKQIHELGLAEVERIRREMYAVMDEAGYKAHDIPGFAKWLAKDKSRFYTKAEDMVRDYRALAKKADAASVKLFSRYPTLPYGIEAIPAHEASGRSGAYYMRGSAENGRPGVFYVNTARLAETPKYEMEALLLHEAVPGHHFQLALTQDLGELPDFRRHGGFTAYIEGWGLYAESLGPEMGFYQTPADRFGALTFEMWRAIRLVVDTGLHALGWTRQQAIEFFQANTGRGLARITAEVDRYLVMPGQALAYKMGELKLKELRARAQKELGDQFDIRRFHDHVLSAGGLPLQVLEARMDRWIADQKVTDQ